MDKNAVRQSNLVMRNATRGAPSTFENLAAESNKEFGKLLSFGGNHSDVAFDAAGNAEALIIPIKNRTI
jgi:hypothetical protein